MDRRLPVELASDFPRLQAPRAALASWGLLVTHQESRVTARSFVFTAAVLLSAVGVSASQYPMLDGVAQKVIQRYQSSTCEQLWEARGKPKPQEEQSLVQILKSDPQMRTVFLDEVAGPVANKMFECGLLP